MRILFRQALAVVRTVRDRDRRGGKLIVPIEIDWLLRASRRILCAGLPDEPLARYLLQSFLTLLVVGPPCVLMGGTLPLLTWRVDCSRRRTRPGHRLVVRRQHVRRGCAGCYLTGFQLLPVLGIYGTNLAAALAEHWHRAGGTTAQSPHGGTSGGSARVTDCCRSGNGTAVLHRRFVRCRDAFRSGGLDSANGLEQANRARAGSNLCNSATLFVVLIGIGSGSLLFHWRCDASR